MSKSVARLAVVAVLIVGLLGLSGCGAAWISYSKESQAKQSALQIQRQQQQIKNLESDLDLAQTKIRDQRERIVDLIGEKNGLVADKENLINQLKKKGYKITITSNGGYEIDDMDVKTSETELESQAQETISELNKAGKEVRESTDKLKKEFGDKEKDKDRSEKKAGK